ncbi:hypothetical protein LX13_001357 [Williamsia maris]|uniref:Uncharacterized protein n=1 Tax=Williamsia maris TaxID=72806 RepID=A0ABT1HBB4_9NOCA|nr:hypothetical protein [Williamsia maris]
MFRRSFSLSSTLTATKNLSVGLACAGVFVFVGSYTITPSLPATHNTSAVTTDEAATATSTVSAATTPPDSLSAAPIAR